MPLEPLSDNELKRLTQPRLPSTDMKVSCMFCGFIASDTDPLEAHKQFVNHNCEENNASETSTYEETNPTPEVSSRPKYIQDGFKAV